MTISQLPLACPPRFGTPRNPDRPSLGPAVGEVARLLGKPFMPWQQYVVDVELEIDPDTGLLWYAESRLTVPRRAGKTTKVLAKAVHRCSATNFFGPRQRLVYTAQTRKDARKRFKEDYEPDLLAARRLKVRPVWSPGDEHIRFPNGSRFGIESTTEKAGHGDTLDEAYIDESFALVDSRVEQSFGPPMLTRRNTQISVISTAGWVDASPYLWEKVQHGRQLVEEGAPARICYFEWSAPADADPYDRAVWRSCMPALGFTISEDAIAAELERMSSSAEGLNGFRRAYLNQWVPKGATSEVFGAGQWADAAEVGSTIVGEPVLVVSVTPDREFAALVAAGKRKDGLLHVEVVVEGRNDSRFLAETARISANQGVDVHLHPGHAAGALITALQDADVRVVPVTTTDYTQGCGAFYDDVLAGRIKYPAPQPELTAAVGRAVRKTAGETWRWHGDRIHTLVAATQAAQVVRSAVDGGQGRVLVLG